MTWHHIMGHKGSVYRPRSIWMERARTKLLLYDNLQVIQSGPKVGIQ